MGKIIEKTEYDKYWETKGDYGRIRIERKKYRKTLRAERSDKRYYCDCCGEKQIHPMTKVENPYYLEMNNCVVMERMCRFCYEGSIGDI